MNSTLIFQEPTQAVVLGYAPMDDVHAEFADVIARAAACNDADFMSCLDEVIRHLRSHFEAEDAWMRASDFPPKDCHMQEHAAVLRSADEVCALPAERQVDVGRAFVRELADWFPGHADYLDSALAAWMCKRAHGGKPIVLHRREKSE
ncbi:cation-binding hemerythrin HHE family protein [Variovorax sp. SRS16]|uniref:hemerythrin domain-containing protein n=1 Tax=Variovorax sp. SRS16 TaxID=282217 RepID=UPI00131742EC|nr:hemerythrin domain-containing protein [Variovorax sp. SRS16]VTU20611.1 cation-binding hemerythrin HHE family protein [Variovorax sp. SRS16]